MNFAKEARLETLFKGDDTLEVSEIVDALEEIGASIMSTSFVYKNRFSSSLLRVTCRLLEEIGGTIHLSK